ncbi:proline--tRNA ligase [Pelodictyon phaeoclathratiforme]|uniref:Proline--tRNA ligase n=1 Tax=Pelodictyon phaeoclathratiforme (strain DSM 5477 / BU-1) TaxID=324925 RepID=SYP_PELPB|nr:proline--tRNA ligase [Pelodictyon phaeoclathratiforme]B4SG51.1 RecName: Full=Proline--tRNA ligase; AltName: Full=Prolyl-tRNA synthetase; Short=ProRS [Pelodictyon phaeoclathratiforme BU-1]ACF43362.1 prolyl-tRNA synthetase [Pelodictyon phaeoclathratiforme BU-1]
MADKITSRSEDYSQWYIDLVRSAKLADYADVRGCMDIRPNGYAIWEKMQAALDRMFKETGHVNAYFPLFIPESFIAKEAEHIEGFAPECAVVTHGGGEELAEKLYIRPTSETIIWSSYKKWIQSYRDLPILINQWANVVRWEMRTRLFLRTTEFLWQEGHTAHANPEESQEEVLRMINVYKTFAEEYMAMPVIMGKKTDNEKFAGAVDTWCIEAMMQDSKALQAGTSHNLGQNFAKAFDCQFQTKDGVLDYVWATSWGVSTRLIGALIMAHSDDRGLVLPPKLATRQVVIIPILRGDKAAVIERANALAQELNKNGIPSFVDSSEQNSPGWKFAEYELQGIPIRIELGPRDIEKGICIAARRDTLEKTELALDETLPDQISEILNTIQESMFERALQFRTEHTFEVQSYEEFKVAVEKGFVIAHWDGTAETEAKIKAETKATIRVLPEEADYIAQYRIDEPGTCIYSGKPAARKVVFAKAY